jgi:hypothetical protein
MSSSNLPLHNQDYVCYSKNKYIGTATFTADPYLGDSFMLLEVNKAGSISEVAIMPDYWVACSE